MPSAEAKSIFGKALELEPAARAAYLDEACAGDPRLRARIDGLVDAHGRAGGFLESPAPTPLPDPTADPPPVAERPGSVIGPYRLMEQVGEGGMGLVFVAEQHRPVRRKVALKVIKPGMDTRQVVARFEAERQALALMDHPNIAKVLDCGETESGRPYFVMELVNGVTVTEYCDRHRLPTRGRLDLFLQVCRAVQHAHQKGVIHRDIKPSNILVASHDGTPVVKVIDFGVAKAVGEPLTDKTVYTHLAQLVGTPLYMSPEQAGRSSLDVDTRTDVYALGVLLYELLTGTTPFDGERFRAAMYDEIRRIIREEDPPRPSIRVSTLGPAAVTVTANRASDPGHLSRLIRGELDWMVMKALEKDRGRRYETAGAFADDIERYLADEPVQACPPSAWYRLRKFARRNKAVLATGAVVAAAVAVALASLAAAVSVLAANNAEVKAEHRQTKEALDREKEANEALLQAIGREQLASYFQRIALAERELEARNVGRAEELLEECPAELRGWEWHYLKRRCREEPVVFRGHAGRVTSMAVSPDGKTVASVGAGEIRVWERATGKEVRRIVTGPAPVGGLVFHPGGKMLISAGADKTLRAWDLAAGAEVRKLAVPEGVVALAVSPDRQLLVTCGLDHTLRVRDAETFQERRTLRGHTKLIHTAAFGPDGRLASASFDGTVRVWDATTGKEVHTLRGHACPVFGVALSRDGTRVASCGLDGTTRVWDAATGRQLRAVLTEDAGVVAVAFSPDGRRLATGGLGKVVRLWDVQTDQEALALRGHAEAVWGLAFSPDGDQLVSCSLDGTVRVWDGTPLSAAPRPGERTLRGHTGAVLSVAFRPGADPAGRVVLASASRDETVRLWNPATGETTAVLHGHAAHVFGVAYSRDGRRVVTTDFSGAIKVWDADTGKEVRTFHGTVTRAALSPDGKRLAFSPDGKQLAASGWTGLAVVWDAGTGRPLHSLTGHGHTVMTVEFSADGTRLVTASWDNTVRVWDAKTGEGVAVLRGHTGNVLSVAFSPGGKWLASSSGYRGKGEVKVWDASLWDGKPDQK